MAQHKLEHAKLRLQQMSLSAPEAGTVVGQVPGVGAFVRAGKPVISLLPARPLQVRAELSAAYADAVQVGMKATVVPDSDGAENTGTLPPARVVRISPVFAQARLPEDAGAWRGQSGGVRAGVRRSQGALRPARAGGVPK